MKKLLIIMAVVLITGGLAGGLSVAAFSNSESANTEAQTLDVQAGEIFKIRLESNPSTGYGWEVEFDEKCVEFLRSYMEELDPGKVGAPGTEVFVLRGLADGSTEITFSYKRPWEVEVLKTETYTVNISGDMVAPSDGLSKEESQQAVEEFVAGCPTFQFDGMADTLELVSSDTLRCPFCYASTFQFQSRHAGYGDRTGQMLAQSILD